MCQKNNNRRGALIILSSPSGAGKSTLARMVLQWDQSIVFSVSYTTRGRRNSEKNGSHYVFTNHSQFKSMIKQGVLLEYAEVFGHFYGTPRTAVQQAIAQKRHVLFDIDWQGSQQIRQSNLKDHIISIFILPPSIKALKQRLIRRGQDHPDIIRRRLLKSCDEISHWNEYDYVLINKNLQECFDQLKIILIKKKLQENTTCNIIKHVKQLNSEFEDFLK